MTNNMIDKQLISKKKTKTKNQLTQLNVKNQTTQSKKMGKRENKM